MQQTSGSPYALIACSVKLLCTNMSLTARAEILPATIAVWMPSPIGAGIKNEYEIENNPTRWHWMQVRSWATRFTNHKVYVLKFAISCKHQYTTLKSLHVLRTPDRADIANTRSRNYLCNLQCTQYTLHIHEITHSNDNRRHVPVRGST